MDIVQRKNLALSKVAFKLVEDRLPEDDSELIRGYIYDHNEWGLGMEHIVDALLEEDISVTRVQRDSIVEAMEAMNLERSQHKLRIAE